MSLVGIDSIWHRKITPGDFRAIERSPSAGPSSGGGQLYIDIPLTVRDGLFSMLCLRAPDSPDGEWPQASIEARVIGDPSISAMLNFDHNRQGDPRYRIRNQNRQSMGSERHPAWTSEMGFPVAPDDISSTDPVEEYLGDGYRIYIVSTRSGDYFAGFTAGSELPRDWSKGMGLEALFDPSSPGGLITPPNSIARLPSIPVAVYRILEAWQRQPNVLLYGPAGTGKTHTVGILWQLLKLWDGQPVLMLDTEDRHTPFRKLSLPFYPSPPVARDWVTFHQNYGYEDFIVGLRPKSAQPDLGFELRPRAGRLLQLAVKVAFDAFAEQSAVLMIDEINRGNTSRIFGEFITFMETAYRDVDEEGNVNPMRLPVPLANVNTSGGQTEEIELPDGGSVKLPAPWFFPRQVYTLASMNSVDRTVAPLDSALARRFERIDMFTDLGVLESRLGVSEEDARSKVEEAGDRIPDLTAGECAILILKYLNFHLATILGPDFEIGHTYMFPLEDASSEEEAFRLLASVWDQSIMPQLQERFLTRQDELLRILKADGDSPTDYAFKQREGPTQGGVDVRPVLERESLADISIDRIRLTFRHLASTVNE